jgi:hypothetical protein
VAVTSCAGCAALTHFRGLTMAYCPVREGLDPAAVRGADTAICRLQTTPSGAEGRKPVRSAGRASARFVKPRLPMPGRIPLLVLAFVVTPSVARAQPPGDEVITAPRLVVLTTVKTKEAGRREALRAARLLDYPIAMDTVSAVPGRRSFIGQVVTLHRNLEGGILVSSYLGDASDVEGPLREARRYFRGARVLSTVMSQGEASDGWVDTPFVPAGMLLVGSFRNYQAAVRAAKAFSDAAAIPYSSQGYVLDKSRGMILPDDDPDEMYRGRYVPRRDDQGCGAERCVTVERSEGYEGFRPGLYIVVAGIVRRDADAKGRLAEARQIVPSAYVRQTILYMGCRH